jgi:hypothetical protein
MTPLQLGSLLVKHLLGNASISVMTALLARQRPASWIVVAFGGTRDHVRNLYRASIAGCHLCHEYFYAIGHDRSCLSFRYRSVDLWDLARVCSDIGGEAEFGVSDIAGTIAGPLHLQ